MARTMDVEAMTEQLKSVAAAVILGASGLTDELTDVEARSVIDQCLLQAEAAVDALMLSADTAGLSTDEAGELVAEGLAPVRRFMAAINALVGKRHLLTPGQMLEELDALRTLAEGLPLPPEVPVGDGALSLLAHWPTDPGNLGFVLAILHVLEPGPDARLRMLAEHKETGGRDDTRREERGEGS